MSGEPFHLPVRRRAGLARGQARARGFTLVELLVSVAMVAVLAIAMGSAVMIASRAVGREDSSAARSVVASEAVTRMASELRLATSFSERTASAATFTIPDRNGDGVEEIIRYAWSVEPGAPLVRGYNAAPEEVIAEDVRSFNLDYLIQTIQPAIEEGMEGAEVLLASHVDAPGGQMRTFAVDWEDWCAQYVRPSLPADAIAWRVTRVQFMARRDKSPADGVISVYITSASMDQTPAYPVLDEARIKESDLASQMTWVEASFLNVREIDPSQGLCIVIAYRSGTNDVGVVQYEERGNPMTMDTHWMTTSNRGYSFTTPNDRQDMIIRVYGTVTRPRSGP